MPASFKINIYWSKDLVVGDPTRPKKKRGINSKFCSFVGLTLKSKEAVCLPFYEKRHWRKELVLREFTRQKSRSNLIFELLLG